MSLETLRSLKNYVLTLKPITNRHGIVKLVSSTTYLGYESHTHAVSTMLISWFSRLRDRARGGGCLMSQTLRSLTNRLCTTWTTREWDYPKRTMIVRSAHSGCGLTRLIDLR